MPLPPRVSFLDPRPSDEARARPILDSANIPLDQLPERMHELPPRSEPVLVAAAGALLDKTLALLREVERLATPAEDWTFGGGGLGRLWTGNEFLLSVIPQLPPGRACDLACGTGRDAVSLAGSGWRVDALDILPDALERGRDLAARYLTVEGPSITWTAKDLARDSHDLSQYSLVTMFAFLDRHLIMQSAHELPPGASLVMETFTAIHRRQFGKPRDSFVLQPGELPTLVPQMEILYFGEGWHGERHTARLWARKRAAQ